MGDKIIRPCREPMGNVATRQSDALLLPFLTSADERGAERHLERLLAEHAAPIITGIIRRRWRVSPLRPGTRETPEALEAQDAYSDAIGRIVAQLWECRAGGGREPIADFRAYVATVTFRACDTLLRRKRPEREALRARLRYLAATGRPLPPDAAAAAVARAACPRTAPEADAEAVPDPTGDVVGTVARRLYLARLWEEIAGLPQAQRAALLLNLRDPAGRGVLPLLPLSGVASAPAIARVLGLPAEDLAGLWEALPLGDAAIAERLGVTRQQVINLRMTARKRLTRRMARFAPDN